jgi:Na+/H+-translocating membrane pyrophosphatase
MVKEEKMKDLLLKCVMCFAVAVFIVSVIACMILGIQMFVSKIDYSPYIVLFMAFALLALAFGLAGYYIMDNEKRK